MLSLKSIKILIKSILKDSLFEFKKLDKLNYNINELDDKIFEKHPLDSLEIIIFATRISSFFNIHKVGIEDNLLRKRDINFWAEICSQSLMLNGGLITFQTSGSTREPKDITHNISSLKREAYELKEILSPFKKIISLVPAHHIYGFLFGVLLPEISNARVEYSNIVQPSFLAENDLIISVPSQWSIWSNVLKKNDKLIKGTTSTGKIDSEVYYKLIKQNVDLFEFYRSTETLGIAYRRSPNDDLKLFSYYSIKNEKIWDNELEKEIELMDFYKITSDRTIKILSRKDGAIKIRGYKIYIDDIKNLIQSNQLVKDCAVRIFNTSSGEKIKCFIVPKEFDDEVLNKIRNFINTINLPIKIDHIKFGEQIPKNEIGKVMDWEL